MRLFALLNFQDIMGFVFPTLLFMIAFGVGLACSHLRAGDTEARKQEITGRHADGIFERNAPFPLVMMLIIAGAILWGFFYIVLHGVLGVKI